MVPKSLFRIEQRKMVSKWIKPLKKTLKKIYERFRSEKEFLVYSPEYNREQLDMLISNGIITKLDASSVDAWKYILRPTYKGQIYFEHQKAAKKAKVKHNIIEVLKFVIPTIISIIALIVSILK